MPLGKKSVFGFGGNALRFGFGGGGGGGEGASSGSSPSSVAAAVSPPAGISVVVAEQFVVESEKSSQDSNATRASLTSSTSPSSLGAQTQLEIQAALASHHQQNSSPPSPSSTRYSSPPSSPHSFLGGQTQGEFNNRRQRHTPFPSSPPSNANGLSPSPTSQHRYLPPSAYEDGDPDEEDQDEDEFMKEFLVDDFETADGERTAKGKGKGKVSGGSSDAEQEDLVEDELMTQAILRKGGR